ncbi:TnsA endonuclease C-terminal domain-containing protein [Paenibacillus elgii]
MARNSDWTEAKFKRFLAEGRGKGEKESYRPWLQVHDLKSRGRSTRFYSKKEKRVIHIFTDTQLFIALLLEWDEKVLSYKEQYPLIDTQAIIEELDELLIKRLKGKASEVPHVMLTTFLVTAVDDMGKEYQYARTLKDEAELNKKPTIERLEIQRRWWQSRNINFGIITPNEIPVQRSKNIQWVITSQNVQDHGITGSEMENYAEQLQQLLLRDHGTVGSVLSAFDTYNRLEVGTGVLIFRYLIANRYITINMDSEINLQSTAIEMGISIPKGNKGEQRHAVNG